MERGKRMNRDEFAKALFGEFNVGEEDKTRAAIREFANFLWTNYSEFVAAGFREEQAIAMVLTLMSSLLSSRKKEDN